MRTAYLIAAHESPRHLRRLIAALRTPRAEFIIHLDAKTPWEPFRTLAEVPGVSFCSPRVPVYWGDFSQVEATLVMLRESVGRRRYSRHVLLSGVDYPVQPAEYIDAFFAAHPVSEFIDLVPMPCPSEDKPLSRLTEFRHRDTDSKAYRLIRRALVRAGLLPSERDPRLGLQGRQPYAGSSWWALTQAAGAYVLEFVDEQPAVARFFENTTCPDEAFFQTAIGNSRFRQCLQRSLTYADWSEGGNNPALIGSDHLRRFRVAGPLVHEAGYGRGEFLFARKFSDDWPEVVDELDRILIEKAKTRP